jgi:hypothetical protein
MANGKVKMDVAVINTKLDYLIKNQQDTNKKLDGHLDRAEKIVLAHGKMLAKHETAIKYTWRIGGAIATAITLFSALR